MIGGHEKESSKQRDDETCAVFTVHVPFALDRSGAFAAEIEDSSLDVVVNLRPFRLVQILQRLGKIDQVILVFQRRRAAHAGKDGIRQRRERQRVQRVGTHAGGREVCGVPDSLDASPDDFRVEGVKGQRHDAGGVRENQRLRRRHAQLAVLLKSFERLRVLRIVFSKRLTVFLKRLNRRGHVRDHCLDVVGRTARIESGKIGRTDVRRCGRVVRRLKTGERPRETSRGRNTTKTTKNNHIRLLHHKPLNELETDRIDRKSENWQPLRPPNRAPESAAFDYFGTPSNGGYLVRATLKEKVTMKSQKQRKSPAVLRRPRAKEKPRSRLSLLRSGSSQKSSATREEKDMRKEALCPLDTTSTIAIPRQQPPSWQITSQGNSADQKEELRFSHNRIDRPYRHTLYPHYTPK